MRRCFPSLYDDDELVTFIINQNLWKDDKSIVRKLFPSISGLYIAMNAKMNDFD